MVLDQGIDLTVIYYSSNREDPLFEREISSMVRHSAVPFPIIAVTQKPMDLGGKNICVGDVGISDENVYRQILLGCMAANTPYVAMAESDCLYPLQFWQFYRPPNLHTCCRAGVWLLYLGDDKFYWKESSLCTQIVGREYLIDVITKRLDGRPEWNPDPSYKNYKPKYKDILPPKSWIIYNTPIPCVNIKTGNGMRKRAATSKITTRNIPYWGTTMEVEEWIL
jgi:hypothetical protein